MICQYTGLKTGEMEGGRESMHPVFIRGGIFPAMGKLSFPTTTTTITLSQKEPRENKSLLNVKNKEINFK